MIVRIDFVSGGIDVKRPEDLSLVARPVEGIVLVESIVWKEYDA
jgi:hypothetical protein